MSMPLIVILRAIGTYGIMLFIFRMIGEKQLSQLTFKDYVVGLCIGSMGGRAITKVEQPYMIFFWGFASLAILHMLLSYISIKNESLRRLFNGDPIILIYKGRILKDNLKKSRLTMDELTSLLREKSVFKYSDIEYAILEPTRGFSVLLKSEQSPVTLKQMNIQPPEDNGLPVLVIKEGKILTEELKKHNLTEKGIIEDLEKKDIMDVSKVLLAQADSSGIIYTALYDD